LRILLDENLPKELAPLLTGHEACTIKQMGWAGLQNGQLLNRAQAEFDIFLTLDQGIPYQQNLGKYEIAVFLLRAHSNSIRSLEPLVPAILKAAQQPTKRRLTVIEL
jgi:predicted nuclease of predicted toxin-antitoxin system